MTTDQIEYSIREQKLKLDFYGNFSHYGIVAFLLILPITLIVIHLRNYFMESPNILKDGEFLFLSFPSALAFLFYILQKSRLKFKVIQTKLSQHELEPIIKKVAKELGWHITSKKGQYIEAKTFPGFFSGSWGEHITIIFDHDKVLVNSICDISKQPSVVSFGRNKKNVNKLIAEISKAST